jgi:hypothetical protein
MPSKSGRPVGNILHPAFDSETKAYTSGTSSYPVKTKNKKGAKKNARKEKTRERKTNLRKISTQSARSGGDTAAPDKQKYGGHPTTGSHHSFCQYKIISIFIFTVHMESCWFRRYDRKVSVVL